MPRPQMRKEDPEEPEGDADPKLEEEGKPKQAKKIEIDRRQLDHLDDLE